MVKGYIITTSYKNLNNKPYVISYVRCENEELIATVNEFQPYFYIKKEDIEDAKKLVPFNLSNSDKNDSKNGIMLNFDNNEVVKIFFDSPSNLIDAKKILHSNQILCYEADVNYTTRFLIDNDIKGIIDINEKSENFTSKEFNSLYNTKINADKIYFNPSIVSHNNKNIDMSNLSSSRDINFLDKLKILSFDIETDRSAKKLFSISLVCNKFKKVLVAKKGFWNNAESFETEKEVLEEFISLVNELNPDIITGWNCIDFDLNVLREMCKKYDIDFKLGRDNSVINLRISENFFQDSIARVEGRQVLDGISLLKSTFIKLPDYKLQTAAEHFLDEGKLIHGDERGDDIEEAFENNVQKLVDYNLKDSELVIEIIKRSGALAISIMRSLITRLSMDRGKASIASLDSLYIKELNKRNKVAPTAFTGDRDERIQGGYVRDSIPGIYDNILVFDFKSLYPSIIRTFNIDPSSFVKQNVFDEMSDEDKEKLIEAPNGAKFRNEEGILPEIIETLWKERDLAKKEKNIFKSNAIKILMNSFFGVLANPNCRFYSIAIANAITHFGQFLIKLTAEEMTKKGHDVIYGDTDSIFIDTHEKDYSSANKKGMEICNFINDFFSNFIENKYNRKSMMEIEFEKVYKKFFMPKLRGSETGAKKRYAGILEKTKNNTTSDEIDIVGLEAVRSDWTEIAKDFQIKLLKKVFNDEAIGEFIRNFIKEMRSGEYDKLLVYSKQIRKPVSSYIKTTPPHIQAARKIGRDNVGSIKYIITTDGPEEINNISHKVDHEHYINKQIKPIAESVLEFFDDDFDSLVKDHKQQSLFDF